MAKDQKQDEQPQKQDEQLQPTAPKLVKMRRDAAHYPAPHEADVHPDEVMQYAKGGFVPVKE